MVDERSASRRCANPTAMSLEERRAKAFFHQSNSLAGRCQRHTSPRGTMRDACRLDHQQEDAKIDQIKTHRRFHERLAPSVVAEAR
jgi:hypothetical protein